ncbi:MAG: phosphoglucosamine mutase [Phycisphaeraceae bacterium]|nr:MAG: phosphoglucosamine mutase [Phycisphaeraceae bacterium]
MGESPLILGVSGLRGVVGESLTPEVAMRYAQAFGEWVIEQNAPLARVVLARDGRLGGQVFYHAAAAGLLSVGCGIHDIGVATTPTVGVAIDGFGAHAGMQITASHNPQQWNGLKCLVSLAEGADVEACAPTANAASEIIARFRARDGAIAPWRVFGERAYEDDQARAHWRKVQHTIIDGDLGLGATRGQFHICVDSVNCGGSGIAEELAEEWGCRLTQLAGLSHGIFPHTPEPTAENLSGEGGLCDAVPGLKADVGFAQDPDGDRLAIVDERGVYIGEEYTLAIAAEALLGAMGAGAKGAVLVTNLSTSRMVEDVAAAYGARVERTAVGEANVVERMKALKAAGENCVLGGEGNGGVIWPEVTYVRDSLGAMALTLGVMAREGKTVSQLVEKINGYARGGGYAIVKRKQALATKADAGPAVKRIAERYAGERVDTQDGVRVDFDSGERAGSWVHVRASNTEPILRLIGEAADEVAAGKLLDEVAGIVNG